MSDEQDDMADDFNDLPYDNKDSINHEMDIDPHTHSPQYQDDADEDDNLMDIKLAASSLEDLQESQKFISMIKDASLGNDYCDSKMLSYYQTLHWIHDLSGVVPIAHHIGKPIPPEKYSISREYEASSGVNKANFREVDYLKAVWSRHIDNDKAQHGCIHGWIWICPADISVAVHGYPHLWHPHCGIIGGDPGPCHCSNSRTSVANVFQGGLETAAQYMLMGQYNQFFNAARYNPSHYWILENHQVMRMAALDDDIDLNVIVVNGSHATCPKCGESIKLGPGRVQNLIRRHVGSGVCIDAKKRDHTQKNGRQSTMDTWFKKPRSIAPTVSAPCHLTSVEDKPTTLPFLTSSVPSSSSQSLAWPEPSLPVQKSVPNSENDTLHCFKANIDCVPYKETELSGDDGPSIPANKLWEICLNPLMHQVFWGKTKEEISLMVEEHGEKRQPSTSIVDLRDAHLSEKKNIWNGEKRDGVDQNIVSEVVQSTAHGHSSPSYGPIKPVTEQTRNYFPRLLFHVVTIILFKSQFSVFVFSYPGSINSILGKLENEIITLYHAVI
ncbi:hypothetical protein EV421DRAFT_1741246 [Armillaria borealis]|uniref:Uncharacterized protein n=1 Tax=Armillaria borealis TaxID=47425 RepID=A0AA39MGD2_9AGAR|nr:hypothetical protein EV421DRAFT_1741246 [Armillaria borealis]